ncbi:MAG: aminotransferase class I/II-fold pyridoxal phosphate-dependent enzyme, partial [Chloroflexota bacterium]
MSFASRVNHLKAEGAYQVLARAQELEAAGRDIIHLEIGEPDFSTASHISMMGIKAIADGKTRYNPPSGLNDLREVIAEDAGRRRGITIDPAQVVVSPGAKPNLFFPAMALIDSGDEVIYPDPGFPTYEAMIRVTDGIPIPVPLVEENDFSFDLDVFDDFVNEKTKLIILNSPGNPTGGVMNIDDLEHIAKAAQKFDCWVLSDEIYMR